MGRTVAEGTVCEGAAKGYLTVYLGGEKQLIYYTGSPPFSYQVTEVAGNDPLGQYWVLISYTNTGTQSPNFGCLEKKFANILRAKIQGNYRQVKGKINGIVLNQRSYENEPTYKLEMERSDGFISYQVLTETHYGNCSISSKNSCTSSRAGAALPGSVQIEDVIPITGGYEYELLITDSRGEQFKKTFPERVSLDDYCVAKKKQCPPGTCWCDCNPNYICCYGIDGKMKDIVYK